MQLPTYTAIWHVERRLYKIEDWVLPVPVSLLQVGVFAACAACWWVLLRLAGVGFGADTGWLYVVPPACAAWAAGRPVAEHKRPHELLVSQLRYLLAPKTLARLVTVTPPAASLVGARVWRPDHPSVWLGAPARDDSLRAAAAGLDSPSPGRWQVGVCGASPGVGARTIARLLVAALRGRNRQRRQCDSSDGRDSVRVTTVAAGDVEDAVTGLDLLILVVTDDGAERRAGAALLDRLEAVDAGAAARTLVVRAAPRPSASQIVPTAVRARTFAVPHDPRLAGPLPAPARREGAAGAALEGLSPATRHAALRLAAAVIGRLAAPACPVGGAAPHRSPS
ncbi:hypothetical protein BH20ACT8_BH20ACT8_21480 [soil metagenome]